MHSLGKYSNGHGLAWIKGKGGLRGTKVQDVSITCLALSHSLLERLRPVFVKAREGLPPNCNDCSHEIRRCLLLGRKAMTSLDRVLKSRDVTSPPKVYTAKAMVSPGVMQGCKSWATEGG